MNAVPSSLWYLNQMLSRCGVCSRREGESLIKRGLVKVNGKVVKENCKVTKDDVVICRGEPVAMPSAPRLYMYHKPAGEIVTRVDPYRERPTVFASIERNYPQLPRLMAVGRLDYLSEGLLLLTNCGRLQANLTVPTAFVRTYQVQATGVPFSREALRALHAGICIDGIQYRSISITQSPVPPTSRNPSPTDLLPFSLTDGVWYTVLLTEGKNAEIRNVFAHFQLTVLRLARVKFGPYALNMDRHGMGAITELATSLLPPGTVDS